MRYLKNVILIISIGFLQAINIYPQTFVYEGQFINPIFPAITAIPNSQVSQPATLGIRKTSSPRNKDAFYMLVSGGLGSTNVSERRLYLSGNINSNSIIVRLFPAGNTTSEIGEIGNANITGATALTGFFNQNGSISNVGLNVVIPASSNSVPDGTYSNTFIFTAYTKAGQTTKLLPPNGTPITSIAANSLAITVTVQVSANAIIIVLDPSTVQFTPALVAGGTSSATGSIRITSTGFYSLSVNSEYSGNLKVSPAGTEQIPYTFSFNGTQVPLTTGSAVLLINQPAESNVTRALSFTTTNIPFVEGGDYFDYLTFVILNN